MLEETRGSLRSMKRAGRRSSRSRIGSWRALHFFIFDLMIHRGRDVMAELLVKRRAMIEKHVPPPILADPIRYSPHP